jgi:competence ComEA-like helix-hairpin-helix protein
MDSESFVEVPDVVDNDGSMVDLNTATLDALMDLPGVDEALAHRILAYREAQGPFQTPKDITNVPGIGQTAYERIADRLTISLPEVMPTREDEAEADEAEGETSITPPPESPTSEEPTPELEPEPVAPPSPPPVAMSAARTEDTAGQPRVESERSLSWLWVGLIGGGIGAVLGVIITLLILAGINGSLDYVSSQAITRMQNNAQNLETEMATLTDNLDEVQEQQGTLTDALQAVQEQQVQVEEDVNLLRERIVAWDELGARVEGNEAEIEALQQRTEALVEDNVTLRDDLNAEVTRLEQTLAEETEQVQANLGANLSEETTRLQQEMNVVSETVGVMQTSVDTLTEAFEGTDERIERVETFFDRLNGLLRDFFGMPMSEVIEGQP